MKHANVRNKEENDVQLFKINTEKDVFVKEISFSHSSFFISSSPFFSKHTLKNIVIAIDGPSGVGKSTTARLVAEALGYRYLDTGAMYRAIALKVLQSNLDFSDEDRITALLQETEIEFTHDENGMHILLDGADVSQQIRTSEIAQAASKVSTIATVRTKLVQEQQRLGKEGGVVVEGRDIGTVVYPDAALKIFMTASPECRAERRTKELQSETLISKEEILQQINERDTRDATREHSPLKKAEDALALDTSALTIGEQVSFIINEAQKKIVL